MDYALQLLLPMLLGFYLGHLLDERTGKGPWFSLFGLICGIVLGIGSLYKRALSDQARRDAKSQEKENKDQSS